jgi:hypothetical protein
MRERLKEYQIVGRNVALMAYDGSETLGVVLSIKQSPTGLRTKRRIVLGNNTNGPFATVMLNGLAGSPYPNWKFIDG